MIPILRRLILALMLAGLAGPTTAQEHPWRLVDADQIATGDHIILTVPLATPSDLDALATEIARRYGVELAAEWPLQAIEVHCFVMKTNGDADVATLIRQMQADGRIRTVQRMQGFEVYEPRVLDNDYQDPLLPYQKGFLRMNALRAHLRSTGAGIRVGVVDSGIDATHPDLAARLVESRDFVGRAGTGAAEAHGTAIAGVIGADADNATGMVGVAPGAQLVGLRACWQSPGKPGQCSSFSLARSLNFAILNRIPVLNLSLGGPPDPLLEELVLAAIDRGSIVVAAWGETGIAAFPASLPGVIAAGRREHGGIPAPSTDVLSTAPGGRYRYVSGSSVAAAHVSGVVALLLASRAGLGAQDVARTLNGALRDGDGGRLLDACAALQLVLEAQASCSG